MELIKCDECQNTFTSNFCPTCGRNRKDIKVISPITFDTYVHDSGECDDLPHELGVDEDSDLASDLRHLNYEVKIVYKIEGDKITAIQMDAGDGLCDLIPVKK